MLHMQDVQEVEGMTVTDPDGNKIGKVDTVYLDNETNRPEFALVNTGLLGSRSSFVPLQEARRERDAIRVPHSKDQVKNAPAIEADQEISPREEAQIYDYYGMRYQTDGGGRGRGQDRRSDEESTMTRSEEEIRVGTRPSEAQRVRLRKYVETEPVDERVQVRREKARIEREPISDEEARRIEQSGGRLSEDEDEVILRSEEPVVEKRTVPKERVKLTKETDVEEHEVHEEARRERIESEERRRR